MHLKAALYACGTRSDMGVATSVTAPLSKVTAMLTLHSPDPQVPWQGLHGRVQALRGELAGVCGELGGIRPGGLLGHGDRHQQPPGKVVWLAEDHHPEAQASTPAGDVGDNHN